MDERALTSRVRRTALTSGFIGYLIALAGGLFGMIAFLIVWAFTSATWPLMAAGACAALFVVAAVCRPRDRVDTETPRLPEGPGWERVKDHPLGPAMVFAAMPYAKSRAQPGTARLSARFTAADGATAFLRWSYLRYPAAKDARDLRMNRAAFIWAPMNKPLPSLTLTRQLQNVAVRDGDIVIESERFNRNLRVQIDSTRLPRERWPRYASAVITPRIADVLDGFDTHALRLQIAGSFVLCEVATDVDQIGAAARVVCSLATMIEPHVFDTYADFAEVSEPVPN